MQCLTPYMPQTSRIYSADGVYPCLPANETGGLNRQAVCYSPIMFKERAGCPGGGKGILCGDKPFTLSTLTDQDHVGAVCYAIEPGAAARLNTESRINENICPTLRSNAGDNQPAVCFPVDLIRESRGAFETYEQDADKAGSLKQCDNKGSQVVCYQNKVGALCMDDYKGINRQYVNADSHPGSYSGQDAYSDMLVTQKAKPPRKYIIRRLTPLECCRLQGFPDWWEDGVQGSDSARYKMWGNGIALPNAEYVIGCAKKLIEGKLPEEDE